MTQRAHRAAGGGVPAGGRAPEGGGVDTVTRGGPATGGRARGPADGAPGCAPGGPLWQALTAVYAADAASASTPAPGTTGCPEPGDAPGQPDAPATGEVPDGPLRRALSAIYTPTGPADPAVPAPAGASTARTAGELLRRAEEDRRLTREAGTAPTPERRRRVVRCHRDNADALAAIVDRQGWPTADTVGARASTAALMILLHAPELALRLRCRDLIAQATADGRCPAVHFAYIADHCAVDLGEQQFYGTRINPVTSCPYPVRLPESLDERRADVGLGPMEEQMKALRLHG
ncbi:DUF6624 domain-containing protein [Streptomyces sp. NPDC021356]|uniref:DUF6624 domain-containing protein n=1 Tax=Streptomyces sp. NPDC021356 TaxID=3154900 RepID=UPI00340FDDC8